MMFRLSNKSSLPAMALSGLAFSAGLATATSFESSSMEASALTFIESLEPAQREKCGFPFDHEERLAWTYLPGDRRGIWIGDLAPGQRVHLTDLLQSVLSSAGYLKTEGILVLESVLAELQPNAGRDPGRYAFTFFGKPGDGRWGWSLEGHHLSLNFTGGPSEEIRGTPFFLGVAPATVLGGPHAGLRPLGAEVARARELLEILDEAERKTARLATARPRDVVLGPSREKPLAALGLPVSKMSAAAREALFLLVDEFTGNLHPGLAKEEMARIQALPLEDLFFCWTGKPGEGPFYFRVAGPRFGMEYACVGNDPNHAHAVWRDLDRDFGADILRAHLADSHD